MFLLPVHSLLTLPMLRSVSLSTTSCKEGKEKGKKETSRPSLLLAIEKADPAQRRSGESTLRAASPPPQLPHFQQPHRTVIFINLTLIPILFRTKNHYFCANF
jgi:hypothetical protein